MLVRYEDFAFVDLEHVARLKPAKALSMFARILGQWRRKQRRTRSPRGTLSQDKVPERRSASAHPSEWLLVFRNDRRDRWLLVSALVFGESRADEHAVFLAFSS